MGRIRKIVVSICFAAAMLIGGAGTAFAAEQALLTDTASGLEIHDPSFDTASASYVDGVRVIDQGDEMAICVSGGRGSKFEIYVNDKLVHTIENGGSAEEPAPYLSRQWYYFTDVIQGASYQVKVVSYSYSANGDVAGGSAVTQCNLSEVVLKDLQMYTSYGVDGAYGNFHISSMGYMWYGGIKISWKNSYAGTGLVRHEIWRREAKGAWKKLGVASDTKFYDVTAVPGKKYQYRIRVEARKNEYASAPAGKWLTSEATKMSIADTEVSLDYIDNVTLTMSQSGGLFQDMKFGVRRNRQRGTKKLQRLQKIHTLTRR